MPIGRTELAYKLAFEDFLDVVGDVMQLYYGGGIGWAKAAQRIGEAAEAMKRRQGEALADLMAGASDDV